MPSAPEITASLPQIEKGSAPENQPVKQDAATAVTEPATEALRPGAPTVNEEKPAAPIQPTAIKQPEERQETPEALPAPAPSGAEPAKAARLAPPPEPTVLPADRAPAPEPTPTPEPIPAAVHKPEPPDPDRGMKESPVKAENPPKPPEEERTEQAAEETATAKQEAEPDEIESQANEPPPDIPTAPRQYVPPGVAKPVQPRKQVPKAKNHTPKKAERHQFLEVRLQALFDHYGFCTLRLLAARPKNSSPEQAVDCAGVAMELIESTDEWYEIAEPPQLGPPLANGILMLGQSRAASKQIWELTGRPFYILAAYHGLAGFVTTPRLAVGREQVVLCRQDFAGQVQAVLATSGCTTTNWHGQDLGAPDGWVFFKPVKPAKSVQHIPGEEMLNLLRPLPEIELALEGGLWLEDSTWMAGFPPKILVSGELPGHAVVQIDGQPAQKQPDEAYRTPAYDAPGPHSVFCEGITCSYSISQPAAGWEMWDPLSFGTTAICGAHVKPKKPVNGHYTKVPTTHPILIGATPGEIFHCESRPSAVWSGYVPFRPVWALPEDPLHWKRDTHAILLISPAPPHISPDHKPARGPLNDMVRRWCRAILDCRRKRLLTEVAQPEADPLWTLYTTQARSLARKLKQHEP